VQAQPRNVTGVIKSDIDGKPIEGVEIRLKGDATTAKSNENGNYSIVVDQKSTETLIFSHPDFEEMEVVVIGKSNLDLTLTSNIRLNQYGQPVERESLVSEARDGVLTFESKDKDFKIWTDFRLNIDYTKFFDNYDNSLAEGPEPPLNPTAGNPEDAIQLSDGGHIRRARFAFKAQVSEKWYGEIDFDFRDLEVDINDVYLQYSVNDALSFQVGQFREPMGMMTNTTSRYVTFMERPLSCELDPSRHMGIGAKYSHPWFYAGAGLFTDEAYGVDEKDIRRKKRTGTESSKAVTGRIMGFPIKGDDIVLGIGAGGSYRTPQITDEGAYTVRVRVNDENRTSQKRFLDTEEVGRVKNIVLANAELAFAYKSFRLQGEYKIMTLKRGKIYDDINYTGQNLKDANYGGYYIEASYYLFGDRQNFNYGDAEFTRINPKSKKGSVEIAARYSYLNLNDEDAKVKGGEGKITSLGITYWAKKNVRIILNAAYVDHDENATSKYKWKVPEGGFDYHWVGTRFEIDF